MKTIRTSPLAILAAAALFMSQSGDLQAQALRVDFDERGATQITQPGWSSFVIDSVVSATTIQTNPTTRSFGGISLTLVNTAPFGYDDRVRATPVNGGALTTEGIYRDFVFSRDNVGTGGLDMSISGLTPNQAYRASIWSYDSSSPGMRVSDWFANGTEMVSNWTFNGAVQPTSDDQYRFNFVASANGAGGLLISGRRDATSVNAAAPPAPDFGVFINALQLEAVPEPGTWALAALGGALLLVIARKRRT